MLDMTNHTVLTCVLFRLYHEVVFKLEFKKVQNQRKCQASYFKAKFSKVQYYCLKSKQMTFVPQNLRGGNIISFVFFFLFLFFFFLLVYFFFFRGKKYF